MTELIACLSSGKGTWTQVNRLIQSEDWEKIFLITNEFGKENFKPQKDVVFVLADFRKEITSLINDLKNALKGDISGLEVALNLVSGEGKEHMAILSALMQLGVGFRLVCATDSGVKEI